MILSVLCTEIICIQAQTKICHRTLILLLHYLAIPGQSLMCMKALYLLRNHARKYKEEN